MIKALNEFISLIHRHYPKLLIVILVFYYNFPQALGIMGRSFILYSGIIGLVLYALHKFPFVEVKNYVLVFLFFIALCVLSVYLNNFTEDFFWSSYLRSQMAWLFSAYMIIFLMFKMHKNPTADTLITYLILVFTLQCVITLIMYFNTDVKEFLYTYQLQAEMDEVKKNAIENQRLFGYGANLFGAGMISGYCLILIMYFIVKKKLTIFQLILMSLIYAYVFYIGLFMARTTIVGALMSLSMLVLLFLRINSGNRKQTYAYIGVLVGLMVSGYSLCLLYFPDFSEWAFEMLLKYQETGTFYTNSSKSLDRMFYLPEDQYTWMFGTGDALKTDSDVGFSRLLFYAGLPATIAYFFLGVYLGWKCLTKDWNMNFLVFVTVVYILAMNYKGWTDMNPTLYLYFFFFLHYKYYVYNPKIYKMRMLQNREMLAGKNI